MIGGANLQASTVRAAIYKQSNFSKLQFCSGIRGTQAIENIDFEQTRKTLSDDISNGKCMVIKTRHSKWNEK